MARQRTGASVLAASVQQVTHRLLESRLSELLGEQVFARTGLGAAQDHAALQDQITRLQQQVLDQQALTERDEELGAALEAPRRLMTETNRGGNGRDQ